MGALVLWCFFYHLGREIFDKVFEDFGFAFIHGVGLCTIEVHVCFGRLKVPTISFDTGEKKQGENEKKQTMTVPKRKEKSELALALEEGGTWSDP